MSFSAHDEVCAVVLYQPEEAVPDSGIPDAVVLREMKKSGPLPQSDAESARLTRRNKLL